MGEKQTINIQQVIDRFLLLHNKSPSVVGLKQHTFVRSMVWKSGMAWQGFLAQGTPRPKSRCWKDCLLILSLVSLSKPTLLGQVPTFSLAGDGSYGPPSFVVIWPSPASKPTAGNLPHSEFFSCLCSSGRAQSLLGVHLVRSGSSKIVSLS